MMLVMLLMMLLLMVVVTIFCRRALLAAKDSLHKGASAHVLDVAQYGEMVNLLGLPALLDAVVDQSNQSSGDDDAGYENKN